MTAEPYIITPDDPRAPSQERWDRMSPEERRRVVASLPSDFPLKLVPEGDLHRVPKQNAFEVLDAYFRRKGRSVYLSSELPVYYPDEPVFAPDLIAVLDVETHPRNSWVVSAEGRGIDFALEIHVSGNRRKDFEHNVTRFSRLGIPEYFVFEPRRKRLVGHHLSAEGHYQTILPQGGLWPSAVLGLELSIEQGRLRFYADTAPLPDARELIERLATMVDSAMTRAEEEAKRAEEEAKRAEEEAKRAEQEAQRTQQLTQRAEEEAKRAEEEAKRAERYAAKLRELGIDPDALG